MTDNDPYAERKQLTFAQAEGIEPLPTQLALGELSQELRSQLWSIVYSSMRAFRKLHSSARYYAITENWLVVLKAKHVKLDHGMSDEFSDVFDSQVAALKKVFVSGQYEKVFGLIQWLLRQPQQTVNADHVRAALIDCRAAYRLLDDNKTIVPISLPEDAIAINVALADLSRTEFHGARTHLQFAAQHLATGTAADSIRESMQAVESVARVLGDSKSLAGALQKLKDKKALHPALESSFKSIYGFTSDEKGIRHPLLDDPSAKVDEYDAMFMIGACSAFVSYLINRSR